MMAHSAPDKLIINNLHRTHRTTQAYHLPQWKWKTS